MVPTFLQKLKWVIDVFKYMMDVNQVGFRYVSLRRNVPERALKDVSNTSPPTRFNQFSTVITTGDLITVPLKNFQCAAGAASNFIDPASRFEVGCGYSQDFFSIAALF